MAMQIDKGTIRSSINKYEKRLAKKIHNRQKRRELKQIDKPAPQYNRYTDGWCM